MAKTLHAADAGLDRSPSHLLHRALQLALDIYAEEAGANALTQRQFAVLSAVQAKEGCTQSELVRATGIDRSTLAELVARLIGKNLLGRERSTLDARANTVRLTDEGRTAVAEAAPRVAAADARILALTPISAFRPRRWRGALLSHGAKVRFEVLEADKRPVSATADNFEVRRVARVEVRERRDVTLTMLFDAGRSFDERVMAEQFAN